MHLYTCVAKSHDASRDYVKQQSLSGLIFVVTHNIYVKPLGFINCTKLFSIKQLDKNISVFIYLSIFQIQLDNHSSLT